MQTIKQKEKLMKTNTYTIQQGKVRSVFRAPSDDAALEIADACLNRIGTDYTVYRWGDGPTHTGWRRVWNQKTHPRDTLDEGPDDYRDYGLFGYYSPWRGFVVNFSTNL